MADSSRSPFLLLTLGFMAGILVAVGGYVGWEVLRPVASRATPSPSPEQPPSTEAAASPVPTAAPTQPPVAESTPSEPPLEPAKVAEAPPAGAKPRPGKAKPPEQKPVALEPDVAAQVSDLLTEGDSAVGGGNYEQAAVYYEEALKLDPVSAKARTGKAGALSAATALRKSFLFDLTAAENLKGTPGRLDGFDTDGVEVKRAAQVPGRIEFDVAPTKVKPGDRFTIRVFLRNTGKKDIKIKEMNVSRAVNGLRTAISPMPRAKEVAPRSRTLLDEMPGVWVADTSTWTLDVAVVSSRGDTYQNQLVWK